MDDEKDLIKKDNNKDLRKIYIVISLIIAFIIIIDQVTKFIALKLNYVDLIPNFLNFHIAENRSGTYGIGSGSTFSYILTNLVVIAVLTKFIMSQNLYITTKTRVFVSFIIAGGISNTIDKIFRNFVVEFIDFKFLPVLNIADIFIFIGWISFVAMFTFFSVHEIRENKGNPKKQ